MPNGQENGKRELVLVDACRPQLTAGKYTLTATQTLVVDSVTWKEAATFWVRGPRFRLAADEIYSVYPPDGQTGPYHDTIPHVVFRRKTLPWERALDGQPTQPEQELGAPWMALLLLNDDEVADVAFAVRPLRDLLKPTGGVNDGIRRPDLDALDPWEDIGEPDPQSDEVEQNVCTAMDVPGQLFRDLTPRLGELSLLAHARKVTADDKEDIAGIGDGWFSVLLANRVPVNPSDAARRYTAVIVSLEGLQDLLGDDEPKPLPAKVRLVVLGRWSFVSRGENFEDMVRALAPPGRDMWLRVQPEAVANDTARTALEGGHVPLPHRLRQGGRTISWYRGPLVPVPTVPEIRNLIYASADEALQLDADSGLFDVSYAAAWQLGRLLGMQAGAFATALFNWQEGWLANGLLEEATAKIKEERLCGDAPVDAAAMTEMLALLEDEFMTAIALEWCS